MESLDLLREIGVSVFDAEGKIKSVDDILFEIKMIMDELKNQKGSEKMYQIIKMISMLASTTLTKSFP